VTPDAYLGTRHLSPYTSYLVSSRIWVTAIAAKKPSLNIILLELPVANSRAGPGPMLEGVDRIR